MTDTPIAVAPSPTSAAILTAAVTPAIGVALATWGPYAIVLIGLGAWLLLSLSREKMLKAENQTLRDEVRDLQAKRLEDAREQRRVIESSTATTVARSEGDQLFLTAFSRLSDHMAEVTRHMAAMETRLDDLEEPARGASRPAKPRRPIR